MTQDKKNRSLLPESCDAEPGAEATVLQLESPPEVRLTLDELVRQGAQRMLQTVLEAEVDAFLERHEDRRDERGRRFVVRNGHLPERPILTGAGPIPVQQPRVRDKSPLKEDRFVFSSQILPPYLRKSRSLEELLLLIVCLTPCGVSERERRAGHGELTMWQVSSTFRN